MDVIARIAESTASCKGCGGTIAKKRMCVESEDGDLFCNRDCLTDYLDYRAQEICENRLHQAAPDLLAACEEAESEARNQLVRLKLCGRTDGPEYENWSSKQEKWASVIAKAKPPGVIPR